MGSSALPGETGQAKLFGISSEPLETGKDKVRVILILGPPGSGKGTQASRLSERLALPHISTGDLLRERILRGDDLGRAISDRIDFGQFVPDQWINQLLDERMAFPDCRQGAILDGYPRTLAQAQRLADTVTSNGWLLNVIRLKAEAAQLAHRFSGRRQCSECGALFHLEFQPSLRGERCDRPSCEGTLLPRADDREEFLSGRLQDYDQLTAPVVELLAAVSGHLLELAASDGSPGEIHERLWFGLMGSVNPSR